MISNFVGKSISSASTAASDCWRWRIALGPSAPCGPSIAHAVRTLFGNPTAVPANAAWPLQHAVLVTLVWIVALLAFAVPATLAAYRRRTTT
jgi:hypothetical protein